jgi:predicted GTPase
MASIVIINKVDSATDEQIEAVNSSISELNPTAEVILAFSTITVEDPEAIKGKRVLVIEDGPTLTHGEMKFGAGVVAAERNGASEVVDPRPWATSTIKEIYESYDVGPVLPAMGYSAGQIKDMEETINAADVDLVLIATPIDLRKLIDIRHPAMRVSYELEEKGSALTEALAAL